MPDTDRLEWDAKYGRPDVAPSEPSPLIVQLDGLLPQTGNALDVAGGAGRNAIWLVQRGLDVTLVDISEVGLEIARRRAAEVGVSLHMVAADIELEPLPAGPWDLVVSVHYLWRPLFADFPGILKPGGVLVVTQPTVSNLQRHDKPPAEYLLDDGELPQLVGELEIVHYEEGWLAEGRHEAVLVARRPV
jgi:tellurite methyltransferase